MDKQDALDGAAFVRGRQAGLGLIPPSLNPFSPGTAAYLQWQQGHASTAFTVDPKCIAPGRACPLRVGECDGACFLKTCEREAA